jgi:hypothetical protein
MKTFFVSVGVMLAAILAASAALLAYALVTSLAAIVLGVPVMVGFALASSSSDGFIPAFGYVTSSAITYIILIPLGITQSRVAKQKAS